MNLTQFREAIVTIVHDMGTGLPIIVPNRIPQGSTPQEWLEISAIEVGRIAIQQNLEQRLYAVDIIAAIPVATGNQKIDEIIERISNRFSMLDNKKDQFRASDGTIITVTKIHVYPRYVQSITCRVTLRINFETFIPITP